MKEGHGALEIGVRGVVQGVGFRPFVHRLALELKLCGWVRNEPGSVRIMIQGPADTLVRFSSALRSQAPPLARIDEIIITECDGQEGSDFQVLSSHQGGDGRLPVSPDVATCPACLDELRDPGNRRHRYPFITCTDCGPRFTVIESMPYDRQRTSMAAFRQCPECEAEYRNPRDRRYHSETNSCPLCGPRIWFEGVGGRPDGWEIAPGRRETGGPKAEGDEALAAAVRLLLSGGVLALRGLGGFHLAADATDERAVGTLRDRKGREAKPLAVMVRDLEEVRKVAAPDHREERLLASSERPIVLLRKRDGSPLAPSVAPGLDRVGIFLPYTPLHHLLLDEIAGPLVMTSGNHSQDPILTENREAREWLAPLADGFLFHDREIVTGCDDSVVLQGEMAPVFLRRARGYAPLPFSLPHPSPRPLLAVGPHLKNTFALAHGDVVYLSQHIGDMESAETLHRFRQVVATFRRLFRVEPEVVVRDLHPDYLSTRLAQDIAESLGSARVMAVQHHHAHVAAVLAEHGRDHRVVGLAFDGTGYGDDGQVWGAEVLLADLESYRRVGHLRYSPLPGGEAAVRNPWRTALGYQSLDPHLRDDLAPAFRGVPRHILQTVTNQAIAGFNTPMASSMGRLFDAAAAVLGIRNWASYEGQAAMEMEAAAMEFEAAAMQSQTASRGVDNGRSWFSPGPVSAWKDPGDGEFPLPVRPDASGMLVMDPLPLLSSLGRARQAGHSVSELAWRFHLTLARVSAEVAARVCRAEGISTVVLSGGVFQNLLLRRATRDFLESVGLEVLVGEKLSPNDGAISYGQAAVAAARLKAESGQGSLRAILSAAGAAPVGEAAGKKG